MRVNVDALDKILNEEINVLDKGFIRVIDYMGSDNSIVQAARVSYGEGTKTVSQDESLIRFLMQNKHTSPFEMCEIKLHVKVPMFIARQWLRHRTANVNEYSARYSIVKDDFYVPERICKQDQLNKQSSAEEMDETKSNLIKEKIIKINTESLKAYNELIEHNIARETARIVVPNSVYTEFYWKIDLHNLLHFIRLRISSHAQYEIREYAKKLNDIVKIWLPFTHKAFNDFNIDSYSITVKEKELLKRLINKEEITQENSGLSKRDYRNFKNWWRD